MMSWRLVALATFVLFMSGCSGVSTDTPNPRQPGVTFDDFDGAEIPKDETPAPSPTPAGDPPLVNATSDDCQTQQGYPLYTYQGPAGPAPHLNIVGLYQATNDHTMTGEFALHIEASGTRVLALSSYEPVHWTVTTGPNTVLQEVILDGYYHQTATVPAGVPVSEYTYYAGQNYLSTGAYVWPDNSDGDTADLLDGLFQLTGLQPSSFHGCYWMSQLTLEAAP